MTVIAGVLTTYLWGQFSDRVTVRRITRDDDKDLEAFTDLYVNLFPDDGTNYSADEIVKLFDGSQSFNENRLVEAQNIILAAKFRNEVVGLLLCHFYPARRKAIISYYGITDQVAEAKRSAASKLLPELKRILMDENNPCDFLFFDLQGIEPNTPIDEARRRRARPIRFRQSARRMGLKAYQLQFPYVCPKASMSDEKQEYPFSLMCIPIRGQLSNPLPRSVVLEFLKFIHFDCYGDIYPITDPRFDAYRDYLKGCMKRYETSVPAEVPIV